MKAPLTILTLVLLIAPAPVPAADELDEAVAALGLLPSQRTGQHITPQERNPFAVKPKELNKLVQSEDTETQESRMRAIFKLIEVTGVRRDVRGGLMALAADLILREGEEVKPVMLDQTETLVVSKVERGQVELTFVETKESTQPRTIILPVRNRVLVSQKLFGQPKGQRNFYTVTGKKATDPAVAAAVASVQQARTGASTSTPAIQSPPVSIVSAMAGLTGLFPRAPSGDGEPQAEASASLSAPAGATLEPAPTPPVAADPAGATPATGSNPVGGPPAAAPPAPAAVPAPAAPVPVPAAPVPVPGLAPAAGTMPPSLTPAVPRPAVPAPVPAPPPTPGNPAASAPASNASPAGAPLAPPPTYLRRHGQQPTTEPEARPARPAIAPPAPGTAPAVLE